MNKSKYLKLFYCFVIFIGFPVVISLLTIAIFQLVQKSEETAFSNVLIKLWDSGLSSTVFARSQFDKGSKQNHLPQKELSVSVRTIPNPKALDKKTTTFSSFSYPSFQE